MRLVLGVLLAGVPLTVGGCAEPDEKALGVTDRDGDGVDDDADCAPDDAAASTATTWFQDADGDGYGGAASPLEACGPPAGYVEIATDCDDTAAAVHPGAGEVWYDGADEDCSGGSDFDQDGDGWDRDAECDDTDPGRYPDPGIPEVWYNGVDENCDGNDGDQDGDGWYSALYAYPIPSTYAAMTGDCWDDPAARGWSVINGFPALVAAEVHPAAPDTPYDGLDGDCAGDDDFDADHDGFASDTWPDGTGSVGDDCDDGRADVHPGAVDEWYDDRDADCAGNDDNDADYDGAPGGGDAATDCDDADPGVRPGAVEDCGTATDEDCDGTENGAQMAGATMWYEDGDGDGWGTTDAVEACVGTPPYTAALAGDCDDGAREVNPDGVETCDGVDEDCDGGIDDGVSGYFDDLDGDGHGAGPSTCYAVGRVAVGDDCDDTASAVYPGAPELCDGQQNNCDGGGWGSTAEDGHAAFEAADGAWTDVTAALAAGTPSSPAPYTLPGDGTLHVCAGEWAVSLSTSAGASTSAVVGPAGAASTTLTTNGLGTILTVTDPGSTLVVEGLTFSSGAAANGGAISAVSALVTVSDCIFTANRATTVGGALYGVYGSWTITDTLFLENTAGLAGGAVYTSDADVVLDTVEVTKNVVQGAGDGYGGGLWFGSMGSSSLTILQSIVSENSLLTPAGNAEAAGLYVYSAGSGAVSVTDTDIFGNTAESSGYAYGGGTRILVLGSSAVTLAGLEVYRNLMAGEGAAYGAGLDLYSDSTVDIQILDSSISENVVTSDASPYGGGVLYGAEGTGGMVMSGVSITSNRTTDAAGVSAGGAGGAYLEPHGNVVTLSGVTVAWNDATYGDGLYIEASGAAVVTLDGGTDIYENSGDGVLYTSLDLAPSFILSGAAIHDNDAIGLHAAGVATGAVVATWCIGSAADNTGLWGNGVGLYSQCASTSSTCRFEAITCDFGATGTSADNQTADLYLDGTLGPAVGDDVSFVCVGTGCS